MGRATGDGDWRVQREGSGPEAIMHHEEGHELRDARGRIRSVGVILEDDLTVPGIHDDGAAILWLRCVGDRERREDDKREPHSKGCEGAMHGRKKPDQEEPEICSSGSSRRRSSGFFS